MIAAVGLAMGALSTVSSLVESAAASVRKAIDPPPQVPAASAPAKPSMPSMPKVALNPGPPIPKFDKHTHAALLAAQEKLRA